MKSTGTILPKQFQPDSLYDLQFGPVKIEMASVTPETLTDLIGHLSQSQRDFLSGQGIKDLLAVCDEAVAQWLKPDHPNRLVAEAALPHITGFSSPMVKKGLDLMLEGLRANRLQKILKEELGDPSYLDKFLPHHSKQSKAFGPKVIVHFLAGNIPALPAQELVRSILVKASTLLKVSSDEPLFTALFAKTLIEIEPRLSNCIAVLSWKGGSPEAKNLEEVAIHHANTVIAMGNQETIEGIQSRLPSSGSTTFLSYGHRVSFGLIGREALDDLSEITEKASIDISIYDQLGCLSPHLYYVEKGGRHDPRAFAKALGLALEKTERILPRKRVTKQTASELEQFRRLYEMKKADGQKIDMIQDENTKSWTVVYEEDPTFCLSPLFRTVCIKPIDDLESIGTFLTAWQDHLQAAGIAVSPDRQFRLAETLGALGVSRICGVGQMQSPPVGWHQDGRPMFSDLIRWVDLEE